MPGLIERMTSLCPNALIEAAFLINVISSAVLIPLKFRIMFKVERIATGFLEVAIRLSTVPAIRESASSFALYLLKIPSVRNRLKTESILAIGIVLALNSSLMNMFSILLFALNPSTPKILPVHNSLKGSLFWTNINSVPVLPKRLTGCLNNNKTAFGSSKPVK